MQIAGPGDSSKTFGKLKHKHQKPWQEKKSSVWQSSDLASSIVIKKNNKINQSNQINKKEKLKKEKKEKNEKGKKKNHLFSMAFCEHGKYLYLNAFIVRHHCEHLQEQRAHQSLKSCASELLWPAFSKRKTKPRNARDFT